jgi:hypothetical protein
MIHGFASALAPPEHLEVEELTSPSCYLGIDLRLIVVIIAHGGMHLGEVLAANLIGRPAVGEIIHHDLRETNGK